jgi:hypothetical protein
MSSTARWVFGACIAASVLMIALALWQWGAAEIRENAGEIFFLTAGGAVWLALATGLFAWFGLSFRDDAVERRNVASLIALCGAVTAAAILYAGGSAGEGPSYLNNIFSVSLAAIGLFALWMVLEVGGKVSK